MGDLNLFSKVCWQHPANLKQTFPPIIWIFTEGEGDGIKSKLPFKIFPTLSFWKVDTYGDWVIFDILFHEFRKWGQYLKGFWHLLQEIKLYISNKILVLLNFEGMVFCCKNCSHLLWEKIVLVIKKNFWNSRLKAENLQNFWDH